MTDKSNFRAGDDRYEAQNDDATEVTGDINDASYVRPGEATIPVQKDTDPVEDPVKPPESNSDEQLEGDEKEAINQDNIIGQRTRAAKPSGSYSEGLDEDELPSDVVSGNMGRSDVKAL
ncbi:uncharacterized protein Z518_03311 [Rhinocladiella mackenziei CBS 650.93]|uniref:Histone chaperone domain-containing protein n=1 Tax=Rhinocladiella mackenziei CBS 650.93 TaxID=1442369 RepID=A0A0D2IRN7_9EURO|nr:uncharacterized protein Z518_03311 [Rhinocladiella mackenziei CBS 650.93]KIX08654.1 hypothetical protein Z518_03311 [Rhinocladiella mackenziei CBS 650.93]